MEHVHTPEHASLHPPEHSAAPFIPADPSLLTPNRKEFDAEYPAWPSLGLLPPEPPRYRSKPLFRGFERPNFTRIAILTALCLLTYPAFYILKRAAEDKSLFVVRLIVSVWCSGVGFAIGYVLLAIGARHLEAASKFTLAGYRHFLRVYFKQPGPR